jgi:cyclic pyranopterin phosphate synthase
MKKTKLAITTNAYLFKKKMSQMKKSGIYSVNIHIDSLIHNKYRYITKRNALDKILESISFGKEKFKNIKINSVIQNGFNDDEIIDFLNFSKKNKIQVRFLELMNTGLSSRYIKNKFFSKAELLKRISLFGNVEKIGRKNPEDPAVLYEFVPMKVIFGIIASETEKFCFNCNRLRLSANGDIFNCLYQKEKFPILNLIKNKYDNDYIFNKFFSFVGKKKSFHPSITSGRNFSMSEIGG